MAGISLQDIFFPRNQATGFFGLKSPLTPSKVKWSAPKVNNANL